MQDQHNLVEKEGGLYVTWESTWSDRPERTVHYYPTNVDKWSWTHDFNFPLPAKLEHLDTYEGGTYSYRHGSGYGGFSKTIVLLQYGKTQPAFSEASPIPCPKVRAGIETRWRFGAWQKYTKKDGWRAI